MTLRIQKETLSFGDLFIELEKLYIELEIVNSEISKKLIERISNFILRDTTIIFYLKSKDLSFLMLIWRSF